MKIDVHSFIDAQRGCAQQILVAVLAGVVFLFDGLCIQLAGYAAPAMMKEWHTDRAGISPVLAAALVGTVLGSVLGGLLADRFGRRPMLILVVSFFGVTTMLCGVAGSPGEMTALRFLSGLGFGAALPIATALVAEWMPRKTGPRAIGFANVGVPMGGALGAAVSASVIPGFGWRPVFLAGGAGSLVLAAVLAAAVLESPCWLGARGHAEALQALLRKAWPLAAPIRSGLAPAGEPAMAKGRLFVRGNLRANIVLTIAFFCNSYVIYSTTNWFPSVFIDLQIPMARAIGSIAYANLAGIGMALLATALVVRMGMRGLLLGLGAGAVVGLGVLVAMLLHGWHGAFPSLAAILPTIVMFAFASGIQTLLYGLAARSYPTVCRSGGVGFAAAMGRLGGICATLTGGLLADVGALWLVAVLLLGVVSEIIALAMAPYASDGRPA